MMSGSAWTRAERAARREAGIDGPTLMEIYFPAGEVELQREDDEARVMLDEGSSAGEESGEEGRGGNGRTTGRAGLDGLLDGLLRGDAGLRDAAGLTPFDDDYGSAGFSCPMPGWREA